MTVATAVLLLFLPGGCHSGKTHTVLYINSYHAGYGSSDDVMAGVQETLAGRRVRLTTFFMDSKRHPDDPFTQSKVREALQIIDRIEPEVIIASDDNAVKYVVVEHFRDGPIPCVFCGVNWTCDQYGLPTRNVTGMLEISPVRQTIETLKQYYPGLKRLVALSEDTLSEQKNKDALMPIFAELSLSAEYVLVGTYEQWKAAFVQANRDADLVFLPTNGAIKGWDDADARAFIKEHIRVPVFTCDDFMMVYAVFGLTKVAREQGEWAARTALEILDGKSPADVPVTRNGRTAAWINPVLAGQIGFEPEPGLAGRCRRVE